MRRTTKRLLTAALPLLALAATACGPFKLKEPPPSFAEVESWDSYTRLKSGDDVGVNITAFHNVKGGTLAFWSEDLIEKLGKRGYELNNQTPVKSKNGVSGTRFDFTYETPTEGHKKFFTAVLFVSDKQRVVVQVAGNAELASKYSAHADQMAREIKIRGCKVNKAVCRGDQPDKLSTPGPLTIAAEDEPKDAAEDEPETEDKPAAEPEGDAKPADEPKSD